MSTAGVIVWERNGDWAPRLRRAFGTHPIALRETRSPGECLARLAQSPASVTAMDIAPDSARGVLEQLWRVERLFPEARSAVLVRREHASYAPALFEAGARLLITTPRQLAGFVRFVRRHLELAPHA